MSVLSLASRTVLAVALAAGLSTSFPAAAHADPAATAQADPAVTANYLLSTSWGVIQANYDPAYLSESGLNPADAQVTRRINWGDGSPIETATAPAPGRGWKHIYTRAGDFHVSVQLVSGTGTSAGVFPEGDTVEVAAGPSKDVLSANYHLVPNHVRVGQAVTLVESEFHGQDNAPIYTLRTFFWGDGTKQEFGAYVDSNPHAYAKPGTYHVTVRMNSLQWQTMGKFPAGNTVIVTGAAGIGNGGGNDGGGLAITGPDTAVIGGAGLALVLGGTAAFVLLRRRRMRFVG